MSALTKDDFIGILADLSAEWNEHESVHVTAERLGLDSEELQRAQSVAATWLDGEISQSHYWPPETAIDRMTGLSFALGVGILVGYLARDRDED